ncbi:prepilin-type N-terminal cleavage/methylation domain-containing protein [Streptomyces sp. NPDC059396]|uniref:prepilin-type N-terminal cleavage/methylation domain-containing protein n=1 Tax=Streptomyces sp. NPDC059396 TaxID=3346819 RepID=UPI0036AAE912
MRTLIEVLAGLAILATLALIIFLAIYTRVSKPVNTALTEAAVADRVPDDARQLQARWDSVIDAPSRSKSSYSPHCASHSPQPDPTARS